MGNLYNENEASKFLGGIPIKTLQRWRLEGNKIPFCKIGRAVRYRQIDLENYVNDNLRHSTSETKGEAK